MGTRETPALRCKRAARKLQEGRLARTVAAHNGRHLALGRHEVQPAQDPVGIASVAEPCVAKGKRRFLAADGRLAACGRHVFWPKRAGSNRIVERELAHAAVLNAKGTGSHVAHGPRRVRCHHNGDSKLAVCAEEHGKEVLLGNWVEHRGGLIQEQQARTHGKRCGKGEHLALAAGEACRLSAEPRLHAKEHAGLGHATAHLGYGSSQVLQAKGHLVPHGVADNLAVRTLEDKAHGLGGLHRRELAHILAKSEHVTDERTCR